MKIRYLPEGGFNKNGSFVEFEGNEPTGEELQYESAEYLSLSIVFDQMEVRANADIINQSDEKNGAGRPITRLISGKGSIQSARSSRFSLSFLGGKESYDEVSLTIRASENRERVDFGGLLIEADLDLRGLAEFYLEVYLPAAKFDKLLSELSESDAALRAHIDASRFPNFYATWSPSVSEGRVIKYLSSERDVENSDDIPEAFLRDVEERKRMLSDVEDAPVSIEVFRPLKKLPELSENVGLEDLEDAYQDFEEPPATGTDENLLRIERNNAILAQVDATVLLTKQVRRTGGWIILFLISSTLLMLANFLDV